MFEQYKAKSSETVMEELKRSVSLLQQTLHSTLDSNKELHNTVSGLEEERVQLTRDR